MWSQDGGQNTGCVSMPHTYRRDWQLWHNLSSLAPSPPRPRPRPLQPALDKLRSFAAQTAARCHTLDPRCQHRVTEADHGPRVPSHTRQCEGLPDCQLLFLPNPKILHIVQHPPRHAPSLKHTHTHSLAQYPDPSDPGGCGSVQRHWQLRLWHANKSAVHEVMLWIKSTFDA